eukprot:GHVN01098745.1.p1 GENE.GHVN01098745.1~~GHVN01098745.1.p1  ORF type:complete len:158 (+),score=18.00 GHVN01098745.1:540-1013(+)
MSDCGTKERNLRLLKEAQCEEQHEADLRELEVARMTMADKEAQFQQQHEADKRELEVEWMTIADKESIRTASSVSVSKNSWQRPPLSVEKVEPLHILGQRGNRISQADQISTTMACRDKFGLNNSLKRVGITRLLRAVSDCEIKYINAFTNNPGCSP